MSAENELYTPTTQEVRAGWLEAHRVPTNDVGGYMEREGKPKERLAEFDRWLESERQSIRTEVHKEILSSLGLKIEDVEAAIKKCLNSVDDSFHMSEGCEK